MLAHGGVGKVRSKGRTWAAWRPLELGCRKEGKAARTLPCSVNNQETTKVIVVVTPMVVATTIVRPKVVTPAVVGTGATTPGPRGCCSLGLMCAVKILAGLKITPLPEMGVTAVA